MARSLDTCRRHLLRPSRVPVFENATCSLSRPQECALVKEDCSIRGQRTTNSDTEGTLFMRPFSLTLAALGGEAVFQKETKSCPLHQVPGFVIKQRTPELLLPGVPCAPTPGCWGIPFWNALCKCLDKAFLSSGAKS